MSVITASAHNANEKPLSRSVFQLSNINSNNSFQIVGNSDRLSADYSQAISIYSPPVSVNAINVSPIDSETNRESENHFDTFCSVQNNDFTRGCCISTSAGSITSAVLFLPALDMVSLYVTSCITSLLCICESMDIAGSEDRQYRAINFLSGMLIFPCLFAVGRDSVNTVMNGCQE